MNRKQIKSNVRPLKLFFQLWGKLSRKQKADTYFALYLMMLSGLCELLSFAALIPFLVILTAPEKLFKNDFFANLCSLLNLNSDIDKITFTTLSFIFLTIFASFIKLINLRVSNRIAALIGKDLASQVLDKSFHRPYAVFIKGSSSEPINLIRNCNKVTNTILGILLGVSSIFVLIFISAPILFFNPSLSLGSIFFFGTIYLIISRFTNKKLSLISNIIDSNYKKELSVVYDSIGSVRNLIIERMQSAATKAFTLFDTKHRLALAEQTFLGAFPRILLEGIGISFIALIGFFAVTQNYNTDSIIAILGTIGLAAQKILPAFQQIYRSWALISSSNVDISNVLKVLDERYDISKNVKLDKPLKLKKSIRFENVHFNYDKKSNEIIKNLSFEIKAGEKVGIIGTSGSGKSTLLDLMMGLLVPTSGKIFIDNQNLHDKKRKNFLYYWHQSISHVPQSIFLSDSSITNNITFSEYLKKVNTTKFKNAVTLSKVDEFVEKIPEKYFSQVGERGINLSGGQRQRIGIARAIYRDRNLLFLDEATSALDQKTEKQILNSLFLENKNLTIIMISHKLETLQNCDRILKIENGKLFDQGDSRKLQD